MYGSGDGSIRFLTCKTFCSVVLISLTLRTTLSQRNCHYRGAGNQFQAKHSKSSTPGILEERRLRGKVNAYGLPGELTGVSAARDPKTFASAGLKSVGRVPPEFTGEKAAGVRL